MSDLKPCPFCGNEVSLVRRDKLYVFACPESSPCRGVGFATYAKADQLAEATAAWNSRQVWQPIDTAPKDGTLVLTYLPPLPHQTSGWVNIQKWKGDKAGWISVGMPKRRTNFQPTHWQPLPTPPEAS